MRGGGGICAPSTKHGRVPWFPLENIKDKGADFLVKNIKTLSFLDGVTNIVIYSAAIEDRYI